MGFGMGLGSGTGLRGEQAVVVSSVAVIRARVAVRRKWGLPQGLKPLSVLLTERPKAEALGYLEAKALGSLRSPRKYRDSSLRSE